ncbi:OX-2 membrane glycoprotein isoform X1 [Parus major]|uniref:OX-2 membrane glycoprotein isoform X1 n=1 Tax=Parus major TaxID=9157 RepID=UPI001443950E|nr:OX-2 membrane glycoprotein isoform X1 [Parus major]
MVGNVPRVRTKCIRMGKWHSVDQSLVSQRTAKMMMVTCLLLSSIWAAAPASVQVMNRKVQSVQVGGNVTFSCRSVTREDVIQVTWQKETDGAEDNIATYSTMNGQKIAKAYVSHVSFAHSELQASAISLHGVTLHDEGCYKCIFNTFPSGAVTGRMCLKVYAISDPIVETKIIRSPDKAEDSEKMVGMSCSATGKPAPKIIWHLPSILQQKPREYHIKFSNQTVTVISNFTHTHSKILREYPITCAIQHPSLNVTLVLPTDSLEQGPESSMAPAIAIAVGVLVPLTSLLLTCLLYLCPRHLRDPERNPTWPCWVGLPFLRVLQNSPPQDLGPNTMTWLCPATPGLPAHCPSQAEPGLEKDTAMSPQPDSWEGET